MYCWTARRPEPKKSASLHFRTKHPALAGSADPAPSSHFGILCASPNGFPEASRRHHCQHPLLDQPHLCDKNCVISDLLSFVGSTQEERHPLAPNDPSDSKLVEPAISIVTFLSSFLLASKSPRCPARFCSLPFRLYEQQNHPGFVPRTFPRIKGPSLAPLARIL